MYAPGTYLLLDLIVGAATIWICYWVTKKAIKEAIKESGLVDALNRLTWQIRRNDKEREPPLPSWADRPFD